VGGCLMPLRRPWAAPTIVALFNRLGPIEQMAVVKATEIVIEARKILESPDKPKK
jgi:hypothetical protein